MAQANEQALMQMPLEELMEMATSRLTRSTSRPPLPEEEDTPPTPAAPPEQTAAPAPPAAEDLAPAGVQAEREESGLAESVFSPESRLSAARTALARQRRARDKTTKESI